MKVLLDECLPKPFQSEIIGHEVTTVPAHGWAGKTNGELLALASKEFDVFVTIDQNLRYQQNLKNTKLGIILLNVPDSKFMTLQPFAPKIVEALNTIKSGQLIILK